MSLTTLLQKEFASRDLNNSVGFGGVSRCRRNSIITTSVAPVTTSVAPVMQLTLYHFM